MESRTPSGKESEITSKEKAEREKSGTYFTEYKVEREKKAGCGRRLGPAGGKTGNASGKKRLNSAGRVHPKGPLSG